MGSRRRSACVTGAVLALCFAPVRARGQEQSTLSLSAGAAATLAVGDQSDFLDGGFGPYAGIAWTPSPSGHVRLALDGAWIPFTQDRDGLTGARADNAVLTVLLRPEAYVQAGPLRPFLALQAGAALGRWHVDDDAGSRSGWTSAAAWGGGAGVDVRLGGGRHALSLRAGGWIADVGELSIARAPDPSSSTNAPDTMPADIALLSLRLGLRVVM